MKSTRWIIIALLILPLTLSLLVALPITHAEALILQVSGTNFITYIPTNNLLGFQDIKYIPWIIYINVTTGNLNSSLCNVKIYDYQGSFTFTAKESCSIYIYITGGQAIFQKNDVTFNGIASVSLGETIKLSWVLTPYYTVIVQNGIHGTASPLGTFKEPVGYQLVITATPSNGSYLFNYWQVVDSNRIGPNPYTIVFKKDMTIYPVFKNVSGNTVNPLMTFILPMVALIGIGGFIVVLAKSRRGD